VQFEIKLIIPG